MHYLCLRSVLYRCSFLIDACLSQCLSKALVLLCKAHGHTQMPAELPLSGKLLQKKPWLQHMISAFLKGARDEEVFQSMPIRGFWAASTNITRQGIVCMQASDAASTGSTEHALNKRDMQQQQLVTDMLSSYVIEFAEVCDQTVAADTYFTSGLCGEQ